MRLAWALTIAGMVAGCGNGALKVGSTDMPRGQLPDGFISSGCMTVADCDDNDPCTVDGCSAADLCGHTAMTARMADASTPGCVLPPPPIPPGSCTTMPANDNAACTDSNNNPGVCIPEIVPQSRSARRRRSAWVRLRLPGTTPIAPTIRASPTSSIPTPARPARPVRRSRTRSTPARQIAPSLSPSPAPRSIST